MSDPETKNLPDYENPPVVETILGIQFDPLPRFRNAHLGTFWKTLKASDWPTVEDAPFLQPKYEQFDESARWAKGFTTQITEDMSARVQIMSSARDRMIQVQNGRLHFNWLGQAGVKYPRYEFVREGFMESFQKFLRFIAGENLGEFRANQWEITYLNHLPKGTVWNTPSDWAFCRLLSVVPDETGIIQEDSFSGRWHFIISKNRGRLHIEWQHGKKNEPEAQEVIVLTLTARGPVDGSIDSLQGTLAGLDLGRETIVRSFARFMTDEANRKWGLKNA